MVIVTGDNEPKPPNPHSPGLPRNVDCRRKQPAQPGQEKPNPKTIHGEFPVLRKFAIAQSILLILLVIFVAVAWATNGIDHSETWIVTSVLSVVIIFQLFNIGIHWIDPSYQTNTWLGLYIIRKKLEEKEKIVNLKATLRDASYLSETWFGYYLARKKLEEKQKIEKLTQTKT